MSVRCDPRKFQLITSSVGGPGEGRSTFSLVTTDQPSDIEGPKYFLSVKALLQRGDKIETLADYNDDQPSEGVLIVRQVNTDSVDVIVWESWRQWPKPLPGANLGADERVEAIMGAIPRLSEDQFTNAGRPDCRALQSVLGWDAIRNKVTPQERDKAWSLHLAKTQGQEAA